jgi:hypothetical protein
VTPTTTALDVPTSLPDGAGQRLYRYAQSRIPGGTQLLSKKPELFLPESWPAYFSRAKGAEVWDLDYLTAVEEVFTHLAAALQHGAVTHSLNGPVAHTGFFRMT